MSKKDLLNVLEALDLNLLSESADGRFVYNVKHNTEINSARIFGGQYMGQSIIAAYNSLAHPIPIHSLQGTFIRGGLLEEPLEYHAHVIRQSKTYSNVMVEAIQNGEVLYSAMISFMAYPRITPKTPAITHQKPFPKVADPETLPTIDERLEGYENVVTHFANAPKPFDWRFVDDPVWVLKAENKKRDFNNVWFKTFAEVPKVEDDPNLHAALFAFSSDTSLLDSILMKHGYSWGYERTLTLTVNHSIWFWNQIDYNSWNLYSTTTPSAANGRALATGDLYSQSGELLANVTQECIMKLFLKD